MKIDKFKQYYAIIGTVFFLFVAAGVGVTMFMISDNKEKNIRYFEENIESTKEILHSLLESHIETLDGVAITIGSMEITDLDHLMPVIREVNNRNTFYRMGFIDSEGNGAMVDLDGTVHEDFNFANASFYEEAMQGKKSLSSKVKDFYGDDYLYYFGVPVMVEGKTVGVIAAANDMKSLKNALGRPMFSKGGNLSIIDSNGKYVVLSHTSEEITDIRETGDLTDVQVEEMLSDLSKGVSNLIEYKNNDGNKMWVFYVPMGINDWYLMGTVEENAVNGGYYSIGGIILILVSAMVIFIFLIFCINRIQMKGKTQLENIAYKDQILNMDNYVRFQQTLGLELSQRNFKKLAFWYLDIDDFKIFNETFGYEAGDQLLIHLAHKIQEFSGDREFFCREASDHFIGIRYYEDIIELNEWFKKLTAEFEYYQVFSHESYRLVLSVGFYCAEKPEELLSVNEVYNRARMAQKSIKQKKDRKYAFYSDSLRHQLLKDNEVESHMKQALENGEFKLYIQPKVNILDNNRIDGGEALVRWITSAGKMMNPGDFIPLFEKNGFIISLDRFMFEKTCQWMKAYLSEGGRPIRLAVNVSRLGIFQEDFLDFYLGIKKKYGIPDGLIELEFTESLAVEDNDLLCRRIKELTHAGFYCALDDFGSGYSSLNTLKDLPIQVLKLDILFFKGDSDIKRSRAIIANVIQMAKQLDIRVVAEGVEDKEQVDFLRNCGCEIVQGFVFEKPMAEEDFRKLLSRDPQGNWMAPN